jgi:hypothetical protein
MLLLVLQVLLGLFVYVNQCESDVYVVSTYQCCSTLMRKPRELIDEALCSVNNI